VVRRSNVALSRLQSILIPHIHFYLIIVILYDVYYIPSDFVVVYGHLI
jgi:hypothetical protein